MIITCKKKSQVSFAAVLYLGACIIRMFWGTTSEKEKPEEAYQYDENNLLESLREALLGPMHCMRLLLVCA